MTPQTYFAHWKKKTEVNGHNGKLLFAYPQDSVSMISIRFDNIIDIEKQNGIKLYTADTVLAPWLVHQPKPARLCVFMIDQGIGDILAFSAVAKYLEIYMNLRLNVYANPKQYYLFKYYDCQNINLQNGLDAVFTNYSNLQRRMFYKNWRRLATEFAAQKGHDKNWFDCLFRSIGIENPPTEYCRPRLKRVPAAYKSKTVIIQHRSTAAIRTARFQDFYYAIRNALPDYKIFVNAFDLSNECVTFIDKQRAKVTIVETTSAKDYIEQLNTYAFVVGTDSGALHWREGQMMPALGIYAPFTTQSRTRDYHWVRSIDIKTDCPLQPCFTHGTYCPKHIHDHEHAPCLAGKSLQDQIEEAIVKYYNSWK